MAGTSIHRMTRAQYLDEAHKLLARLAMGAIDGDGRGSRFPPTALRCASFFGNAVGAFEPDENPAYAKGLGFGATVEELFAGAAAKLESGPVHDAAHELLAEFYMRVQDDLGVARHEKGEALTPRELSEIVADVLVRDYADAEIDGDGASLWIEFMRAAYPDSGHLRAALAIGAGDTTVKGDSQANLWTPWAKPPGTF